MIVNGPNYRVVGIFEVFPNQTTYFLPDRD